MAYQYDHRAESDYNSWSGALFPLMSAKQKQQLFGNIACHIKGVPADIVGRQLERFAPADPAYAEGVRQVLAAQK